MKRDFFILKGWINGSILVKIQAAASSRRNLGQRSSFLSAYSSLKLPLTSETKAELRPDNKCEEKRAEDKKHHENQQLSKISFIVLIVDIVPQKCHVRSHKSRAEIY